MGYDELQGYVTNVYCERGIAMLKWISYRVATVELLKADVFLDHQKCPFYRGVRLIELIFNINPPLGH